MRQVPKQGQQAQVSRQGHPSTPISFSPFLVRPGGQTPWWWWGYRLKHMGAPTQQHQGCRGRSGVPYAAAIRASTQLLPPTPSLTQGTHASRLPSPTPSHLIFPNERQGGWRGAGAPRSRLPLINPRCWLGARRSRQRRGWGLQDGGSTGQGATKGLPVANWDTQCLPPSPRTPPSHTITPKKRHHECTVLPGRCQGCARILPGQL